MVLRLSFFVLIFSLVQLDLGYNLLVWKKIIDSQKAKVKHQNPFACTQSEENTFNFDKVCEYVLFIKYVSSFKKWRCWKMHKSSYFLCNPVCFNIDREETHCGPRTMSLFCTSWFLFCVVSVCLFWELYLQSSGSDIKSMQILHLKTQVLHYISLPNSMVDKKIHFGHGLIWKISM